MVPIVIICYNNYKYVDNMIKQLKQINHTYVNHIQILDNCSTCVETQEYLKKVTCKVIYNKKNQGPWITGTQNVEIFRSLPKKYIVTDADLELNKNLPNNFIEQLLELSNKYNFFKIGFALDISDSDKMFDLPYFDGKTIYDWEKQFWTQKIPNDQYELYGAPIDTTFSLINKEPSSGQIRVAGNFTAKHLPWYKQNPVYTLYESYTAKSSGISTTDRMIKGFVDAHYLKINKNKQTFLFENDLSNPNLPFWRDIYNWWEGDTFVVFDRFLRKDKIFIDIGGWIGTTCMYGSRLSKHVYSVEADKQSYDDMSKNCSVNCINNYTLLNNAIYDKDDTLITFGKNKFIHNSKLNDSTSQIYLEDEVTDGTYSIKTITINKIIEKFNINPTEISLIKVDIEGGEEFILNDLYNLYNKYNTPLYISFHYDWWKNKDLNRFSFLTEDQKQEILKNPFGSLLFK